ncbi:hypothetical protein [Porphyromonas pogonae]|uniref:hypothetical protein n=1 Tax=Porphyromonas pogonae TaxID=867595 RepID=UPI002E7783AD|nr:hypothetical protein [Porphyromonas pogonae]
MTKRESRKQRSNWPAMQRSQKVKSESQLHITNKHKGYKLLCVYLLLVITLLRISPTWGLQWQDLYCLHQRSR